MDIRKIGAAAGFAAGAAFALAPLASADVGIGSTVDSEISMMNKLFDTEALLAGKAGDIIPASMSNPFDTIPPADAPTTAPPTILDYELYGVKPIEALPASDPGSYNVFNGALGKFDDAYNVFLYASQNGGAMDMNDADFIGSQSSIDHAQSLGVAGAEKFFLQFGVGDLKGYFGIFPASADSAAATPAAGGGLFDSLLAGEVNGLNHIFDMDVHLAGIPSADIIPGTGVLPFDTIDPANTNSMFDTLLYGFNPANITPDPGSYDVLNGSLGEFANAFNVESFSLLNGGDMLPLADLIGTHADLLNGTVSEAISGFLHLGLSDLFGYF